MRIKRIPCSLFFLMLTGYVISSLVLQTQRDDYVKENIGLYKTFIPPTLLYVLAGEFTGIVADYTLIEAATIVGSGKISDDQWESIAYRYRQTMELDPWFDQSVHLIHATLPWNTDKLELSYSLINKSRESRYWDWIPGYFLGFDYFYFEKNYKKASELLLEAAKKKGAPNLLVTFGARLAQQAGLNKVSINFLQSMYDKEENDNVKKMLQKRIQAHQYIEILEHAIKLYVVDYSKKPISLLELVTLGYLKEIKKTPYGKVYKYDNKTGLINF